MFKLLKKNYYRIVIKEITGIRGYYIVKAKNEEQAKRKFERQHVLNGNIISIEKVEVNEIE